MEYLIDFVARIFVLSYNETDFVVRQIWWRTFTGNIENEQRT